MDLLHWLRCVATGGSGRRHRSQGDCIDAGISSVYGLPAVGLWIRGGTPGHGG
jgi:hypothetical protein